MQEAGKLVAAGSHDGTCTLLELSEGLYNMARNEKNLVTAVSSYIINGNLMLFTFSRNINIYCIHELYCTVYSCTMENMKSYIFCLQQ